MTLIAEIAKDLPLIVASFTAIWGISAWRREYKGKRDIELAEDVLVLFYQARDAIALIRNPISFQSEGATRTPQQNETDQQKWARDNAHVAFERYSQQKETFTKLWALRYRFMARFGHDSAKPFDDLNKVVSDIFHSARVLALFWSLNARHMTEDALARMAKDQERHEQVFWWQGDKDDPVEPRVQAAVSEMEKTCSKIIDAPGVFTRLWHRLKKQQG